MYGLQRKVSHRERENGGKGNMSDRSLINIYIKGCQLGKNCYINESSAIHMFFGKFLFKSITRTS